jgi:integrase
MTEGSVYKRCYCKDPTTGRRLGGKCPKLRRTGGAWNANHGTWGYQLELPTAPGKDRRQLRPAGFDSRDDAIDERDQARALLDLAGTSEHLRIQIADLILEERRHGRPLPQRDTIARRIRAGVPATVATTTAEYLTAWLAARRGLSEKTLRGYGDHIRLYLIPHLGKIPIQTLDTPHIEAMFVALELRNAQIREARASTEPAVRATVKGVRPLSAASLQRLRATLRKALNDSIHRAHIRDTNPAVGIELASGKAPKPRVWTAKAVARWKITGQRPGPVMVWPPALAGAFLDYAEAHDIVLYAMYVLILHRALRRGEACGLRDEDVDLGTDDTNPDEGDGVASLTIVQQITEVGYRPIIKEVKSEAGDRVVPLGPLTVAVLRAYLVMRERWRQVCGDDWPDTGLFFVRPDGQAWHPQTVTDRFDHLIAKSGLPPVRLHDLRHCAATYLRHGGADMKEVQETLGHSTMALTSDTYTSVILELQRENADAAASLIPRDPPQDPPKAA